PDGRGNDPSWREIGSTLKGQRHVYYYSFPQSLANSFSQYLPILLLTSVVTPEWIGFYTMAFTVAVAPIALVGTPIRRLLIRDYSLQREGVAKAAAVKYTAVLICISASLYA